MNGIAPVINPLSSEPLVSLPPPDGSSSTRSLPLSAGLAVMVSFLLSPKVGGGFEVGPVELGPSGLSEGDWSDALRAKVERSRSRRVGGFGTIPSVKEWLRESPAGRGGIVKSKVSDGSSGGVGRAPIGFTATEIPGKAAAPAIPSDLNDGSCS